MVIYDLRCPYDHRFEGWFDSCEDYKHQRQSELLCCPQCGEHDIDKLPHASAMVRSDRGSGESLATQSQEPTAKAGDLAQQVKEIMHQVAAQVRANTEDVGTQFSDEAIRMHRGEKQTRPIRGTANGDQEKEMLEEQVPFIKVPMPRHDA